jgi:hypothetical protein
MCVSLVGLEDVDVVGWTVTMQLHIVSTTPRPDCSSCGTTARILGAHVGVSGPADHGT